ncbi:MAG: ATP-binding protein [Nitrospirota bacterium]
MAATDGLALTSRTEAVELERQRVRLKWKNSMRSRITQMMRHCGVPPKFAAEQESTVSSGLWHSIDCIFSAQGLYIFGRSGVGKTHIATLCVKTFILRMEPVFRGETGTVPQEAEYPLFTTAADMLLSVRDSFRQRDFSENDMLKRYSSAPLLVLDDLGGEKVTEWSAKTLYTVINRRYAGVLPVIITSAMNLKELEDRYNAPGSQTGSAMAQRISETSKILSLQPAQKKTASGRKRRTDERV